MPAISRRSLQAKGGITIRTRKGVTVFPETSPQNATPFGTDNLAAGGPVSNGITIFSQGTGGGIENESGGILSVTNSTFTHNLAIGGAGATSLPENGFEIFVHRSLYLFNLFGNLWFNK